MFPPSSCTKPNHSNTLNLHNCWSPTLCDFPFLFGSIGHSSPKALSSLWDWSGSGCSAAELRMVEKKRSDKKIQSSRPSCISQVRVLPQIIPVLNRAGHAVRVLLHQSRHPWSYRGVFSSCVQTRVSPDFPGICLIY